MAPRPWSNGPVAAVLAVAAGAQAPSAPHWAFVRPERPQLPAVRASDWPRQPIDFFILARLEEHGVAPAPEADRATLARRLALDLTGLPLAPEEVAAFVADERPEAYDALVDRLLASPHYGERMAQDWLDLARYADTNGFGDDTPRQMWLWRDWVIESFNRNQRFDEFTVEQLAGDLLPAPSLAQRIATGFHRNHPLQAEADGQPGEYHHRHVADRVATTGATWLGLTVGCAECHDHKVDPLSQRDYYRLFAFFDNLEERGLRGGENPVPSLAVPSVEQGAQLLELGQRLDALAARRARLELETAGERERWLRSLAVDDAALPAADVHLPLDESDRHVTITGLGQASFVAGVRGGALHLDGNDSVADAGDRGVLSADAPWTISAWLRLQPNGRPASGAIAARIVESGNEQGYWLGLSEGRPWISLVGDGGDRDEIAQRGRDAIPPGEWHHVAATYDGSRSATGLRLWVDGAPVEATSRRAERLVGSAHADTALRIGGSDGSPFAGAIDEVRIHSEALPEHALHTLVTVDLAGAAPRRGEDRGLQALLERFFATRVHEELRALAAAQLDLRARHRALLGTVPVTTVMVERATPRTTYVRPRGDYRRRGERVDPGIPGFLPPLPADAPPNRLGLARWLVHPDHPLVGRVVVNRLWRRMFGRGLVVTEDDFGPGGAPPSHPRLLDWLARAFVDDGFDLKRMVQLMVTSATYRQSSHASAAQWAADPDNIWCARAGRWRLDAEAIRDNALAIAGLLDRRVGGPSVRPPQPAGLWPEEEQTAADAHWRRGLYVHVWRTISYAGLSLFDAPNREVCVVRRSRTNTPLQALALLNDPVHVEAAAKLGARMRAAAQRDLDRLRCGLRRCVGREPTTPEIEVLMRLLARLRAQRSDRADERVWSDVAAVLLNLDETITRN